MILAALVTLLVQAGDAGSIGEPEATSPLEGCPAEEQPGWDASSREEKRNLRRRCWGMEAVPTDAPLTKPAALPRDATNWEPPKPLPRGDHETDRFEYRGIEPPGFHLVSEVRGGLLGAGIATFAVSYALMLVACCVSGSHVEGAVPLLGPILWAANVGSGVWFTGLNFIFAAIDVMSQVAGVAMMVAAVVPGARWLERDRGSVAKPSMTFAPGASGSLFGASLVGRF